MEKGRRGSLGYVPSKTRHAVEWHWESSLLSLWGGYSSCVSCIEDTVDAMGLLRGFPMGKYEESTFTTCISLEDFTVFVGDLSGLQGQPSLHMYTLCSTQPCQTGL